MIEMGRFLYSALPTELQQPSGERRIEYGLRGEVRGRWWRSRRPL